MMLTKPALFIIAVVVILNFRLFTGYTENTILCSDCLITTQALMYINDRDEMQQ